MSDKKYLLVKPQGEVTSVRGDGTENGLRILVAYLGTASAPPQIIIPDDDNQCDAIIESIAEAQDQPEGQVGFDIRISTSVCADTGGCSVWVKQPDGTTVARVAYSYALV